MDNIERLTGMPSYGDGAPPVPPEWGGQQPAQPPLNPFATGGPQRRTAQRIIDETMANRSQFPPAQPQPPATKRGVR